MTDDQTPERPPPIPPALVEFMSTDWAESEPLVDGPSPAAPFHARRRDAISARFPGDWLIVPTGGLKVRANDTDYRFRPGTDFAWLTGSHEPDNVLVMEPLATGGHRATLYVAPRSDRSTSAFFSDRRYGELWVGPRLGLAETRTLLRIETAPLDEGDRERFEHGASIFEQYCPVSGAVREGVVIQLRIRPPGSAPAGPE